MNFLSCWTSMSFLEPTELTSDVWASIRKEWFRSWTDVLDKTASLIQKCTSAPTDTSPPSLVRILEEVIFHNISRSMASIADLIHVHWLIIVIGSNCINSDNSLFWAFSAFFVFKAAKVSSCFKQPSTLTHCDPDVLVLTKYQHLCQISAPEFSNIESSLIFIC